MPIQGCLVGWAGCHSYPVGMTQVAMLSLVSKKILGHIHHYPKWIEDLYALFKLVENQQIATTAEVEMLDLLKNTSMVFQ